MQGNRPTWCLIALVGACGGGKSPPGKPDASTDRPDAVEVDALPIESVLDPTFGMDGVVESTLLTNWFDPIRAALAPNDAIVVGGRARTPQDACGVMRFSADGAVDTTFGTDGLATVQFPNSTGCQLGGIAIQNTSVLVGLRVLSNPTVVVLCRLTANGTLDATFGNSAAGVAGCAATSSALSAYGIAVLADQTIHFGANWDLYRYTANGTLAGTLSIFSDDPVYVKRRKAGGIFVTALATRDVKVTAYSSAHAPVAAYGTNGTANAVVTIEFQDFAMNLRSDDRVLVGAKNDAQMIALAQLTAAGAPDPTWGTNGTALFDVEDGPGESDVGAIAIRTNGDAFVFTGSRVLAVDASAEPVPSFGTNGTLDAEGLGIMTDTLIQSTGKLVAVGTYGGDLQLVRFP